MGFSCERVSGGMHFVQTPLTFPDGEPIALYFMSDINSVSVSDNANTISHLSGLGMEMHDRKKWRGVRQIVQGFGMELRESGEISGKALPSQAESLVGRYLSAMLAVADLERQSMVLTEEMGDYLEEVELHLRAWKAGEKVATNAPVRGNSGRTHTFNFKIGEKLLVDVAKPHSGRTGSIMRKSADIQNSEDGSDVLVIMDDRDDPDRAKEETNILSTLVSVMTFKRLMDLSGGQSATHH